MRRSRWNASISRKTLRKPSGGSASSTRCGKSRSFLRPMISRLRRVISPNRLSAASRVLAPIRDQTPAQRVERYLSGLVIAADDEQFLAGRAIPSRRIVVETTVAHVHAIDDGIAKRPAALDDPPTHGAGYSHPSAGVLARQRPHEAHSLVSQRKSPALTAVTIAGCKASLMSAKEGPA